MTGSAIYLGGFFPDISSEVTINGTILPGDGLDFENVFGLEDSKNVIWGGARWRISKRNLLEFEFADLKRNGSVAWLLGSEFQIGDSLVHGMGAQIDTTFDVTLGRLTYGFAVIKDEKKQLYLKGGVHIADLGASFQMSGRRSVLIPGETTLCACSIFGATPKLEAEEITVPLPHFGGAFSYAFTPKLVGRLQALVFALEVNSHRWFPHRSRCRPCLEPVETFWSRCGAEVFRSRRRSDFFGSEREIRIQILGPGDLRYFYFLTPTPTQGSAAGRFAPVTTSFFQQTE